MIKGCQKKIIFLESTKSKYFDQAYLVMKDDLHTMDEGEILLEAERIIFGAEYCKRKKNKKSKLSTAQCIFLLSCGTLLGLCCAFGICFFII